jgi:hypothetical protein
MLQLTTPSCAAIDVCVFFLNKGKIFCFNLLIKDKFDNKIRRKLHPDYSPGINLLNFFAPAIAQWRASVLIFWWTGIEGA